MPRKTSTAESPKVKAPPKVKPPPKAKAAAKPRQKKANGYKFPERLPEGEVLIDIAKKEWILGPPIGKGGFGEIYCATSAGNTSAAAKESFVIKIEPHENGPLFVERNFYLKVAKPEFVDKWKKDRGIKVLGLPMYIGSGTHEFKNEKYRFIVMDRFGNDLWNIFLANNKVFPPTVVYKCAIQIIDVLNYIHDKEYVHGDIKGANLLLGIKKGTENNVFLVDFGLACKYNTKEFKKDPKKAHNGTIEYTSNDMHIGVPTRRGDMEILGYNLLHWLVSELPWEKDLKNPDKVHEKKKEVMENVKDYMKKHYPEAPKVLTSFLDYVAKLKHDEAPDYEFCKELFAKELKTLKSSINGELNFSSREVTSTIKTPKKGTPRATKRKSNVLNNDISDCSDIIGATPPTPKSARKGRRELPLQAANSPLCTTKPKQKKEVLQKPSWRDAPTIVSGYVVRPEDNEKKEDEASSTRQRSTRRKL